MTRWLTTVEAGEYTNLSTAYLAELRKTDGGPPFVVVGKRKGIRYSVEDLDAWMNARKRAI
jgi:hypothetical protein